MSTEIILGVLHSNILFAGLSAKLGNLKKKSVDQWRSMFWRSADVTLSYAPGCIGMLLCNLHSIVHMYQENARYIYFGLHLTCNTQ